MYYPNLVPPTLIRETQTQFDGLSGRTVCPPTSFSAMENLTAAAYPAAATRPPRGTLDSTDCKAMLWLDGHLVWLDGSGSLHSGAYTLEQFAACGDGRDRTLVAMGARVCVFPDNNWCSAIALGRGELTADDHGSLEARFTTAESIEVRMCTADAASYTVAATVTPPTDPVNGDYWLDLAANPRVLRQWTGAEHSWRPVTGTHVRLSTPNIGRDFAVGDTVSLRHFTIPGASQTLQAQLAAITGEKRTIRARDRDYIVVDGVLDEVVTIPDYANVMIEEILSKTDAYSLETLRAMTDAELEAVLDTLPDRQACKPVVERTVPELDFVVEQGNRLWGCRCDGRVNELYASALGDAANWWRFEGLSTDAWQASRGADGAFTGAIAYGSTVLFFRQSCVEKIYPAADGAHQVVTTRLDGVLPHCGGSLQLLDGIVYYLSAAGVMAYDGSLPVCVSRNLAGGVCHSAVAGTLQGRYYLSCVTDRGDHLLVYEPRLGLWHREDATVMACCAASPSDLFYADRTGQVYCVLATAGQPETGVAWLAESPELGLLDTCHRWACRLELHLLLEADTAVQVLTRYDNESQWHLDAQLQGGGLRLIHVPVRQRRCARMKLRLQGTGHACLLSLARCFETGSERGDREVDVCS